MNKNIELFLKKLADDKKLQEQFKAIKDPDKAYELAASVQSGFTKGEFVAAMTELNAKMSRDLSDDDLEKAAGGSGGATLTTSVTITTTAAAATAAL